MLSRLLGAGGKARKLAGILAAKAKLGGGVARAGFRAGKAGAQNYNARGLSPSAYSAGRAVGKATVGGANRVRRVGEAAGGAYRRSGDVASRAVGYARRNPHVAGAVGAAAGGGLAAAIVARRKRRKQGM